MTRIFDGYCKLLDMLIALALAIMVVLVFGNVVLRYAFNSGITVSEEVSRWLFVWVTFLGAAVAVKERGHLGTDFLVARLPVLGKKVCLVVGHLLMLYATWLLFSGSLAQAKINWDVEAPVTGASVAIFYASGIVFAVSAAVFLLSDLVRALTGRLGEEELVMVQESEDLAQLGRDDGNPHGKR
ncbi:TRAP transporter small permease [Variovorax paradoxus]|jgi:TRAP-type C4-dicarboxylate transport system permease small subunit|uniref:TRAP transporter small permease n=1 Tax=Variovorax paradoxus TaxID=34073 RepID=UPI00038199D2|nr:TRAP transporter small permease [Variovorax paradoxus]MBW8891073.1 TRAP transporter small permease [Burkholderiales bacterium]